jgi:hypothetical protein
MTRIFSRAMSRKGSTRIPQVLWKSLRKSGL